MLSFAPHVVKNTPVKLELVKPNSETTSKYVENISGNLSIKKPKVEEHFRTSDKGTFKIFPLIQMQSSEIDLHRSYGRNFMKKEKLNNL